MKRILGLTVALIPFLSGAQESYTVHTKLGMPVSGQVYLNWYNIKSGKHLDSATVSNGEYVFKGKIDEPEIGQILFSTPNGSSNGAIFYLESGNIQIDYPQGAEYPALSGTPLNNDLQQYNEMLYAFLDSVNATRDGERKYSWWDKEIMPGKIKVIQKFIAKHPASLVSLEQLDQYAIGNKTPDILDSLYNNLSDELKSSPKGIELASRIKGMRSTNIGDSAPVFTLPDTNGHNVSLADFKGKYVLVDFWATWCGPCMAEMPNVKSAYNEYKNKGFEIIGVSLDRPDSKAKWKEVIQRDHLDWKQVSDLNWWNSKAALSYNVNSVPANFLIDPNGKIIAKNLRGEALQDKLKEIFK
ncbi:hypothetical protein A9P82_04765 [Arachidicoccus ginsenosidimutans]|uniref:TlpA disulfide reductase family protein n=1 Tax=Arachidicoccus sp. BS20 TaxID=1850526 RepID=UPI0007F0571B|nr:TlpA disulfide reductase family protein [Arachidicoccus sp. BS20]ANI88657.1 hypothetical protein A9P82_04765 [Arachidicoccus sp. BS20]